ncbi:hypothetical protein AMAG_00472 [Allomyces macrogynus ATCC 38327]|uniref:CKK domain-containing protein n=1 Tax=Allomyces macrogynus (strain ATCC 38327) TaxID=578462 RepID=A0A0L0RWL1_ALLM3|nr:hypothetical protein AMAG_00472 [Allomyces macrogynus ATCC 38327]|eukprot:KNE54500.1 hypothetical protein AMAG_00472 [Allomyces macrogynus ATCC 38327]
MTATGPRTAIAADDAQTWLSTIIDSPVTAEDCRDGFIFVQLLGIMDPAAIDVTSHIGSGAASMDYWKILEDAVSRCQRLDTRGRTELGSTVSKTRDAATIMVANPRQWSEEFTALTARFRILMREHQILISDDAGPDHGAPQAAEDFPPAVTSRPGLPMLALDTPRSDPNFDLCVLHLLFLCRDDVHPQSQVANELSDLIANQIKHELLSSDHSHALSQGYIYALVAQHLGVDGVDCPVVSSIGQEPPTRAIEQALPQLKALDGEAYHLTILTHLLDRRVQQLSKLTFASLESHLRTLPGFEEGTHTPFDMEDALLIWLTLLQPCADPEAEFSDLFVDVAQPGVWPAILHKVLGGPEASEAVLFAEANGLCAVLPPKSHSRTGKLLVVLSLVRLFERSLARSSSAKRIRLKKAKLQRVDPKERGGDSATSLASARQAGSATSTSSSAAADRIASRSASSAQIALAAEFESRTKSAAPSVLDLAADETEPEVERELECEIPSMSSFHAVSPVPGRGTDSDFVNLAILDSPSVHALDRPPSVVGRPPSVMIDDHMPSILQPLPYQPDGDSVHNAFDLDAYFVHPVASPETSTEGHDAGPAVDEDVEPAFVDQDEEMDAAASGDDLIRDLEVFVDDLLDCYDGPDDDDGANFDGEDEADILAHRLVDSSPTRLATPFNSHFLDLVDRNTPTPSVMQLAPSAIQDAARLPVAAVTIDPPREAKGPRPTWAGRASTSVSRSVSRVGSPAMSRAVSRAITLLESRAESPSMPFTEFRAMSRVDSRSNTVLGDRAAAPSVLESASLGPVANTDPHARPVSTRSRLPSQFAMSSIGSRTGTALAVAAAEIVDCVPVSSNAVPVAPTPPSAQSSRPTTASTKLLFHNDDFDPERAKKRINRLRQRLATPTSTGESARSPSRPASASSNQGGTAAAPASIVVDERVEPPVQVLGGLSVQAASKTSSAAPSEPTTPRTGGAAAKIMEQQRKIMSERNLGKAKKSTNIIDRNVKNSSASRRSNKKLIVNALNMCLSGPVNEKTRTEVLEDLERSDQTNFVVLLRGPKNHSFKGLYVHVVDQNQIIKLYGNGPLEIEQADVSEFFKYDSGSRSFKPIPTRSFSTFVHGVAVQATVKH